MKKCKMIGYVEKITSSSVSGWVANLDNLTTTRIRIKKDSKIIVNGETNSFRPDVEKRHSLRKEFYGFIINLGKEINNIHNLIVEAFDGINWVEIKPISRVFKSRPPAYQDFDGNGASKSDKKMKSLALHNISRGQEMLFPLKGKSVLDIGCNEGYFCLEAFNQGAARVVGIDSSIAYIELAKKKCSAASFIHTSWWKLPDEKFDVILFLSAIHYETNQRELLGYIQSHLNPNGVLILECGVAPGDFGDGWLAIPRWDGLRRYPHRRYLINNVLSDYDVKEIGPSVMQAGDPIPRHVFHCYNKKTTAILISGVGASGKSSLARYLRENGTYTYSVDYLFIRILNDNRYKDLRISIMLKKLFNGRMQNFSEAGTYVIREGLMSELIDLIVLEIPKETKYFVIESEFLIRKEFLALLVERLADLKIESWLLEPKNK